MKALQSKTSALQTISKSLPKISGKLYPLTVTVNILTPLPSLQGIAPEP
jgi:hypothetical protein